jgi:hypothetical protein
MKPLTICLAVFLAASVSAFAPVAPRRQSTVAVSLQSGDHNDMAGGVARFFGVVAVASLFTFNVPSASAKNYSGPTSK